MQQDFRKNKHKKAAYKFADIFEEFQFVFLVVLGDVFSERDDTKREVVSCQPRHHLVLLEQQSTGNVDDEVAKVLPVPVG